MFKMRELGIAGVRLIEPRVFGDERGYFMETWTKRDWDELGLEAEFVQDNESQSSRGVLRGLHYQVAPYAQSKLVRVVSGKIFDVVVDIRKESPTFGKYETVELSDENKLQLFVPRGIAHGFLVLSAQATFIYRCDNYYSAAHERCIRFDDPDLSIPWPIDGVELKLSGKDLSGADFRQAELL